MKKRLINILLAFTLVIVGTIGTSGIGVLANDLSSEEIAIPTPVSPEYSETSDQYLPPLGALTDEEIEKILEEINGGNSTDWLFNGWEYGATVTNITTGYLWRDWQVTGGLGGTVSLSQTFGIENGYSAEIEFSLEVLTASVGYDVTYTSSSTALYSHDISSNMYGHIGYSDFFDNTYKTVELTATHYVLGIPVTHLYDTALTWSWTRFVYAYGETSNAAIRPPIPSY